MTRERAVNSTEAFHTFDPFALIEPDDPWWCDLEAHFDPDHYGVSKQLRRRYAPVKGRADFVQVGIVGHKGTGKSTLVRRALAGMSNIFPVYIDALQSFDPSDLSFGEIVLVMTRAVLTGLDTAGVQIDEAIASDLYRWYESAVLSTTRTKELSGSVEGLAEAGGGLPWIGKLLSRVTAVFRSNNEYRQEIRRNVERYRDDLMVRTNALLDAANLSLSVRGDARLCIVFDNLEKISDRTQVERAIIERSDEFHQLRSHLVLFFDPADQYAPTTTRASNAFDLVYVPALPLRERQDVPDRVVPEAIGAIRELIDHRAQLSTVFDDPDACVESIARFSGGRLRDALLVARTAAEFSDPAPIGVTHIEKAARRIGSAFLTKPESWPRLAQIHRDKQVADTPLDHELLKHSLVLIYDGEPWWDVHPLVRLDARFASAWQTLAGS